MLQRVFRTFLGQKNGFQGQNNVQNGSKRSDDVPRVFVKCVGVGVGVGVGRGCVKQRLKRGWRFLFFFC